MTEASPCLDMADMEELAWVSVRETASDLITSLNRRSAVPAHGREERHRFVCHMLRTGHVHDATKMENGFGHISYLVTLEDQETGKRWAGSRARAVTKRSCAHPIPSAPA